MEATASNLRANRGIGLKPTGPGSPNGKEAVGNKGKSEKQSQISLGI